MLLSRLSPSQLIRCRLMLQNPSMKKSIDVALSQQISKVHTLMNLNSQQNASKLCSFRQFSGSKNNEDDAMESKDPFGVDYEDGESNLGPESELPPQYIRDTVSGKFTGETEVELTQEEKKLLEMSEEELETLKIERLLHTWEKSQDGSKEDEVAKLIRAEKMRLNTFGRKSSDVLKSQKQARKQSDDEIVSSTAEDPDPVAPLSTDEFASFQAYLEKHKKTSITEDDIPTVQSPVAPASKRGFDPDQDLSWVQSVTNNATTGDAWMEDILPSDLAPPRKLNRKEAKPIPKKLLHHNNLALLRRYVTPGGQILNRVQSRLGAKDQRKVAKLVKRARALGLIPYVGQWKYEDHGDLFANDINEDREWEKELKQRGLVIEHKLEDFES